MKQIVKDDLPYNRKLMESLETDISKTIDSDEWFAQSVDVEQVVTKKPKETTTQAWFDK